MSDENITTLSEADFASFTEKNLIVKKGHLDDRTVNIMLDSGATCNVVKPGLLQRVTSEVAIQVTRFDGTNTTKRKVKKGVANICFDGNQFSDIPVIEWPMSNSQDVILGKPWFTAHEPIINWRTHQVSFKGGNIPQDEVFEPVIISSADFSRKLKT